MSGIIAVDPGPVQSAYVALYADGKPGERDILPNADVERILRRWSNQAGRFECWIEMCEGYGLPVGRDVFETCVWIGRFMAAWQGDAQRMGRKDVKLHLCGNTRAKDSNIRTALIDRFGGVEGKAKAIGRKASPGPLYGFSGDAWAALALAVTAYDKRRTAG